MTTRILSESYVAGYYLHEPVTVLSIATSGYVGGKGVYPSAEATQAYTVINDGLVDAGFYRGVGLGDGGRVINGTNSLTKAEITGAIAVEIVGGGAAKGLVENFGFLYGTGDRSFASGVYARISTDVVNGGAQDHKAFIEGASGIFLQSGGAVTNFGDVYGMDGNSGFAGVLFGEGGKVTNGTTVVTNVVIKGCNGVAALTAPGFVQNFGTIYGDAVPNRPSATYQAGVYLGDGGRLTNGSAADTTALVTGVGLGVFLKTSGIVINYGAIQGMRDGAIVPVGVRFVNGGALINGSAVDTGATISAYVGVEMSGKGLVTNFGTLMGGTGGGVSYGVLLARGARLTNGSADITSALVEGSDGVFSGTSDNTVINFGVIVGTSKTSTGAGVYLENGGSVTNGSDQDALALIDGQSGVRLEGLGTVTNFGTIEGDGGIAVDFRSVGSTLVVEAGSRFIGAVYGNGGTLDLASGAGSITSITPDAVTLEDASPSATFSRFGSLTIAEGASFTLTGSGAMGGGGITSLAVGGTLAVIGALTTGGAVSGSGTLSALGGTTDFASGTSLKVAHTLVSGASTVVEVSASITYGGSWTQTGGTLVIDAKDRLDFTGGAALSTLQNSGLLIAAAGLLTVNGAVTGPGKVEILAATIDLTQSFGEAVVFSGSGGVLELAQSQGYTGTISGFSTSGTNSLDLADITFVAATQASYSGTATSGVLVVTDGSHTAKIKLSGNFTTSTFTLSSDGHGGTTVVDPTRPAADANAFVAAMAGFGSEAGGNLSGGPEAWRLHSETLVMPGARMS